MPKEGSHDVPSQPPSDTDPTALVPAGFLQVTDPANIDVEQLNAHIAEFEKWFVEQQRAHGMEGGQLVSVEHAILRSYIIWQGKRLHA